MRNPATFITKDGVSDADLIAAARDMYKALQLVSCTGEVNCTHPAVLRVVDDAIAKARGERS